MSTKDVLTLPDEEIVTGWNKKTIASSSKLSALQPFVQLLYLIDNDAYRLLINSQNDAVRRKLINNSFDIVMKNDDTKLFGNNNNSITRLKCINISRNETQLKSHNMRGGVGINSLSISRGTKESFNIRYDMRLDINDSDEFDERPELISLTTLNSIFLIIYGWSGCKVFDAPEPPSIANNELVVDLKSVNQGFWKSEIVRLYKYEFNLENMYKISANISFMSPHNAAITFMNASSIQDTVKNVLSMETYDRSFINNTVLYDFGNKKMTYKDLLNIDSSIKNPTIKMKLERKIKNEDGTETVEIENVGSGYVYLGWVLESLKHAVNDVKFMKNNLRVNFRYIDIPTNNNIDHVYQKFISSDERSYIISKKLHNVFQIPVSYDFAMNVITSSFTTPVLDIIRNIIGTGCIAIQNIKLGTRVKDGAIEIFVATVNNDGIEFEIEEKLSQNDISNNSTMCIKFNDAGSLCESIDLTSKLDPNAFTLYKMPVEITNRVVELTNRGENFNALINKLVDAGFDRNILELTLKEVREENSDYSTTNILPQTFISRLMQKDAVAYSTIIKSILSDHDVFGKLLGFYLRRTSIVIHGTVGINAYNVIAINGIIKNLEGIYNILEISENIENGKFTTVIEAALKKAF